MAHTQTYGTSKYHSCAGGSCEVIALVPSIVFLDTGVGPAYVGPGMPVQMSIFSVVRHFARKVVRYPPSAQRLSLPPVSLACSRGGIMSC
jgi:hypothetical protein